MVDYKFDDEEIEILEALHKGTYKVSETKEDDVHMLKIAAHNFYEKTQDLSMKLSTYDFNRLQSLAIQEGLDSNALAASIIHKYLAQKDLPANP